MSRELVRQAAADWLTAAEIPGLVKVYPAKLAFQAPQFTAGNNFARAMGYILLDTKSRGREKRIAFGGAEGGEKQIDHPTSLILNFWAPGPTSDDDWLAALNHCHTGICCTQVNTNCLCHKKITS